MRLAKSFGVNEIGLDESSPEKAAISHRSRKVGLPTTDRSCSVRMMRHSEKAWFWCSRKCQACAINHGKRRSRADQHRKVAHRITTFRSGPISLNGRGLHGNQSPRCRFPGSVRMGDQPSIIQLNSVLLLQESESTGVMPANSPQAPATARHREDVLKETARYFPF